MIQDVQGSYRSRPSDHWVTIWCGQFCHSSQRLPGAAGGGEVAELPG